jgi:DNA-binding MarR family transcriptional regulator
MQLRQGGLLISKIHQLAGRIFAKKLRQYQIHEINPAQGRILFVLWENDGISIQQLAQKTQLGKSTLTSMLDRLEADGFITRSPSKNDRREILINRTEKDKAFQDSYLQISQEMIDLFYQGFTDHQVDEFEKSLIQILNNLIEYNNEGS